MGTRTSHQRARRNAGFGEPPPGLHPAQIAKGRIALGWLALFGGLAGFGYRLVPGVLSSGAASMVFATCMLIIVAGGIALLLSERWAQTLVCGLLVVADVAIGASMLAFADPRAFANPLILVIPLLFSAGLLTRPWFVMQCLATLVILLLIPRHIYASTPAWLALVGWNTFALLLAALAVRFLRRQALDALARTEQLSNTDFLTGLSNRRDVDRRSRGIVGAARRSEDMVMAAVLDLDHFKCINDTYGHDVGDQVLIRVAHAVRSRSGPDDVVARTGGEEILVLSLAQVRAADIAERAIGFGDELVRAVAAIEIDTPLGPVRPTCSVGVAIATPVASENDEHWLWRLVVRADNALLQAKRSGRGRCVAACPVRAAGPVAPALDLPPTQQPRGRLRGNHVADTAGLLARPRRRRPNSEPSHPLRM